MTPEDPAKPPRLLPAQYWHYYQRYPYLLAKVALWGIVVGVIYWLTRNVESVLFPVATSMLLAYLLDPAVDWLEAKLDQVAAFKRAKASRTLAILVFMGVILLATIGFILILYPALAKQVGNLIKRAPELAELAERNVLPWIEQTTGFAVPATVSEALAEYGGAIREQIPSAMKRISQVTAGVLTQTGAVVASLLNLVMIPVFSFYFLRDFDLFKDRMKEYVPLNRREFYMSRFAMMDEVVGAWFRGQVTVALILALLYGVGLAIVFGWAGVGVGSGIAIGVLSGILNIIPYFGFLIGFVLSVLMVLLDWSGIGPLIGVGVVFAVVQGLEGWVITPKIVGDKVGLSPVMVIIVLLLGGELFGLLGVLLALPLAGIVRALMPDIVAYYKATPFYSGDYSGDSAVVAAAAASSRSIEIAPMGLAEETDGSVEDEEPAAEEEAPEATGPDPSTMRRPVTGQAASVGDRPTNAAVPLDVGTDGDAQDAPREPEPEPESKPVEPESKPKVSLPKPRPKPPDGSSGD